MCSLEKWSRFSFRYVNFNVPMDLLNIFSSLWELISFGALALPGRTCLFCLTPELDSVLAILAKSCLGAVLCQMWVWKNGTPFHWVSVYTEVSWNFIPFSFSTYFSHTFLILFSYCPYTEVFPQNVFHCSALSTHYYFRYHKYFENGGWTGTAHYTSIMHDRLSMYSTAVQSIVQQ